MEVLGIGPLELVFILIIALIVLGPNEMVRAGRTLGRVMRSIVTSPTWKAVRDTSKVVRNLPYQLMREAGFDENEEIIPRDFLREERKPNLLGPKPEEKAAEPVTESPWTRGVYSDEPEHTIGTPAVRPEAVLDEPEHTIGAPAAHPEAVLDKDDSPPTEDEHSIPDKNEDSQ